MNGSDDAIEIVPYDPTWVERFEEEAAQLRQALAPWLIGGIEHIGSTAVPGLSAKPVIDIMGGVKTLATSRGAIAAATNLGYCYWPYRAESEHWFCKPSPANRTHHLHLVPVVGQEWLGALAFRDHLRANEHIAREYESLKRRLAIDHPLDREAYTEAKRPFIERVTGLALRNGSARG